jgi:hypothetical protein
MKSSPSKCFPLLFGLLLSGWVWADPDWTRLETRALSATARDESNLTRLAAYLCPESDSELQKARSIFRWVADRIAYDVGALQKGQLPSQRADEILRTRKAICVGYATLFQELARRAGLQAVCVEGRVRVSEHLPHFPGLPKDLTGHTWNAVKIEGRWQLMDVTWASGGLDSQGKFGRQFTDFWFATPPEQFIYTHLPSQERWQLLRQPVTAQRFDLLPCFCEDYFRLGAELLEPQRNDLKPGSLQKFRIRFPKRARIGRVTLLNDMGGVIQLPGRDGIFEGQVQIPKSGLLQLSTTPEIESTMEVKSGSLPQFTFEVPAGPKALVEFRIR